MNLTLDNPRKGLRGNLDSEAGRVRNLYCEIGRIYAINKEIRRAVESYCPQPPSAHPPSDLVRGVLIRGLYDSGEIWGEHAEGVRLISRKIAERVGITGEALADIETGAAIHDLGKVGVRNDVLNGRPDEEQKRLIRLYHPFVGYTYLVRFIDPEGRPPEERLGVNNDMVRGAVLYHHELLDGTGYPFGLRGEEIPVSGAVVSLANLVHNRFFKRKPWTKKCSVDELKRDLTGNELSRLYAPDVADACVSLLIDDRELLEFLEELRRG